MLNPATSETPLAATLELPPLVLHPVDSSDAPAPELDALVCADEATIASLEASYSELRMLCYLGRDLDRWLSQCVEFAAAAPALAGARLPETSFISQLLFHTPVEAVRKLQAWGVENYQVVFSRALGLNALYAHPPSPRQTSETLLREFPRYADALFEARMKRAPAVEVPCAVTFHLYASNEYCKLLESSWQCAHEI